MKVDEDDSQRTDMCSWRYFRLTFIVPWDVVDVIFVREISPEALNEGVFLAKVDQEDD